MKFTALTRLLMCSLSPLLMRFIPVTNRNVRVATSSSRCHPHQSRALAACTSLINLASASLSLCVQRSWQRKCLCVSRRERRGASSGSECASFHVWRRALKQHRRQRKLADFLRLKLSHNPPVPQVVRRRGPSLSASSRRLPRCVLGRCTFDA